MLPTFYTSRLIVREIREADAPSYEKYFVDYNVIRTLSAVVPWPYPKRGVLEYLRMQVLPKQGNNKWVWAITLKESPEELIGVIDLWRPGKPENRGFWLGHKFWGKGYMTEAVEPVMDYAFDRLGFEKLTFANAVGNLRSRRVKEKTGAVLIGREPARFVDPTLTEHEIFELTKTAWQECKEKRPSWRFAIRDETAADCEAIWNVTSAAFEHHPYSRHTEQFIINALRAAGALTISLVAELGGQIAGHVAFSPIVLSKECRGWYGLGPLSVLPAYQRRGIGTALVREGLSRLQCYGAAGCVLVGDPGYYERFGFRNFPELGHEGVPQEYVLALSFKKEIPCGVALFHRAFLAQE